MTAVTVACMWQIRVLEALSHPNIVRLRDVVRTPSHICLMMDCVDGVTMDAFLENVLGGYIDEDHARRLFAKVCERVCVCLCVCAWRGEQR